MSRKEANRFEESLQRAAQGEKIEGRLGPLVETAKMATTALADPPPPPPDRLMAGRRRFMNEAARLQVKKQNRARGIFGMTGAMRLAGTLVAAMLVLGLVLGTGQAAAASLPGTPLYSLKMLAQDIRRGLTTPENRGEVIVDQTESVLDDTEQVVEQKGSVNEPAMVQVKQRLNQLADAAEKEVKADAAQKAEGQASQWTLQQLTDTLQQRQQKMQHLAETMPQAQQEPMRELLREMEEVRNRIHNGQGAASGNQNQEQKGTPSQPEPPDPAEQPGPGPGPQATQGPGGPNPTEQPGPGPQPTEKPAGPKPTEPPGEGPGPNQPEQPGGPGPGPGQGGPKPTPTPSETDGSGGSGQGGSKGNPGNPNSQGGNGK